MLRQGFRKLPCKGARQVHVDEIIDMLQVVNSANINNAMLSKFSNGRIGSLIDLHHLMRIRETYGSHRRLEEERGTFLAEVLKGIPTCLKRQCIINHVQDLKKTLAVDGYHFYQHLMTELGLPQDDELGLTGQSNGHGTASSFHAPELEYCPTFSEGFLGMEEERGGRPVPVKKMPNLQTTSGVPLTTYPSQERLDSMSFDSPRRSQSHLISDEHQNPSTPQMTVTRSYNSTPNVTRTAAQIGMGEVQMGAIPQYGSFTKTNSSKPSLERQGSAFGTFKHLSVQDLMTGDVPNLAHLRHHSSTKNVNESSPTGDGHVLSWLDLTSRPTVGNGTMSSTNLGAAETSAFFSTTNLLNHTVVAQPGSFRSPVGQVTPFCRKKLIGRTFKWRLKSLFSATIPRPPADSSSFLWSCQNSFWAGPPKRGFQTDKRYAVEGTTDWTQVCTPGGLREMRRQLWCLDLSMTNLEFCPAVPLLQICLFAWGLDNIETFTAIHKMMSYRRRREHDSVPQIDWITRRKDFVLHIQYCLENLQSVCPKLNKHLTALGFDLAAWMARHMQELLGRLLPWRLLEHLVFSTIFLGASVPVGYLLTIVCGLEGALLKCQILEEAGEVLGASHNIVNNWYVHVFNEKSVDEDLAAISFMTVANRMVKKLSLVPHETLTMTCNSKVTPYLMEVDRGQLYRVRFTNKSEAPPNCILTWHEWSAIWHALHPLYRTCSPLKFFDMNKDGNNISAVQRAINEYNTKATREDRELVAHASCCLCIFHLVDPNSHHDFKLALMIPHTPFVQKVHGAITQHYMEGNVTAFYQFKEGHTFTSSWAHDKDPYQFTSDPFDKNRNALSIGDAIIVPHEFGHRGISVASGETVFGNISAPLDDPVHWDTASEIKRRNDSQRPASSSDSVVREMPRSCEVLNVEFWTF